MKIDVSTPALLFPAISLLFLAYTNRFLHLAALIRTLHQDSQDGGCSDSLRLQIDNLRRRLELIRWMQLLGAGSLIVCVVAMVAILADANGVGFAAFVGALALMGASLATLLVEIAMSGGALRVMLTSMGEERSKALE